MKYLKHLSILTVIDFISFSLIYFITKYILKRVREYYSLIQSFTNQFEQAGMLIQNNASLVDPSQLNSNLEVISQLSNNIIFLLSILLISFFIIFLISRSISLNLILNKFKLKDYKNYLKKFVILSIPIFITITYLIFKIIVKARPFILDFWFENYFNYRSFISIVFLVLILFLVIYILIYLSVLINNNTIKKSLQIFSDNLKKLIYFIPFTLFLIISALISIFIARLNTKSTILIVISFIIFLSLVNILKIELIKKLS